MVGKLKPVALDRCRKEQGRAEADNTCLQTPGTCESCPNWGKPKREPVPFVAVKTTVYRGNAVAARAISHTMARRIARALNEYKPGSKGY